ncbi:MAG: hypothetical protein AAF657_22080 [Acidobacteriota bacterium]
MKKKKNVRPLKLDRETLRDLTPRDLERNVVRGGREGAETYYNSCWPK